MTPLNEDTLVQQSPAEYMENEGERFRLIIWRDRLTDAAMDKLGLSDRQKIAVGIARRMGQVTNRDYQKVAGVSDRTILRDINDLVNKGVFEKIGITGRKTYYVLRHRTRQKPDKPDMVQERCCP